MRPLVLADDAAADGSALDSLLGEISDGVGSGQAELAAVRWRPGHVVRYELDDVRAEHSRAASEEADSKSVTGTHMSSITACPVMSRQREGRPPGVHQGRQSSRPQSMLR